jgi:hypothetical protein
VKSVAECSEFGLRGRLARNPRVPQNRKTEIWVIEDVKELTIDAQLHAFGQLEPLGQIRVAPEEIGTAQGVPAQTAELAVLQTVTPHTGTGARIDNRNERVGVEPLDRSRLTDATDWIVFVQ